MPSIWRCALGRFLCFDVVIFSLSLYLYRLFFYPWKLALPVNALAKFHHTHIYTRSRVLKHCCSRLLFRTRYFVVVTFLIQAMCTIWLASFQPYFPSPPHPQTPRLASKHFDIATKLGYRDENIKWKFLVAEIIKKKTSLNFTWNYVFWNTCSPVPPSNQ